MVKIDTLQQNILLNSLSKNWATYHMEKLGSFLQKGEWECTWTREIQTNRRGPSALQAKEWHFAQVAQCHSLRQSENARPLHKDNGKCQAAHRVMGRSGSGAQGGFGAQPC